MGGFIPSLLAEMGARRRRLRAAMGDRGQAIVEFLVLSGLALGSVGLVIREWMVAAAPWGFAIPFLFVIGFLLIDARRQAALARNQTAPQRVSETYDWVVLLWSFGCALVGAAAFVIALTSAPEPAPQEEIWSPPESSVPVDILP